MIVPTIETTIDGFRCATDKFPAKESLFLQFELIKYAGPLFTANMQEDAAVALTAVFRSPTAELVDFVQRLLKHTTIVVNAERFRLGDDVGFNGAFAAAGGLNLPLLVQVLSWVVQVNFKGFTSDK